jgi:HAD superfamily hydrolase (TIGR01509 family)
MLCGGRLLRPARRRMKTMPRTVEAAIFDVDGVLLASPHERAWREALVGIADPAAFTTRFYQTEVAGKPRLDGALAALRGLGVAGAEAMAAAYAERKQKILEQLIAAGAFTSFADAVALARDLKARGLKLAVASSSKNATAMLRLTRLPGGGTLDALFDANLCGRQLAHGKPHPEIFLLAAQALGVDPARVVVVEDAPAGIEAACAGGMLGLGIARLHDTDLLRRAGAALVVTDLGDVDREALERGVLRARSGRSDETDMRDTMQAIDDPDWLLSEHGYSPLREPGIESRFAVSNGFLGVRASRAVSRGPSWMTWQASLAWASWPRTYVAGLFDTPNTDPAVPALVPAADWLRVRITLDGQTLLLRRGRTLRHCRTLDMRRGLLLAEWQQRVPAGVVAHLRTLRLVSQAERALGLQLLTLALDRDGVEVDLEASFEAAGLGMLPVASAPELGVWQTTESGKLLAMAGAVTLSLDGAPLAPAATGPLRWRWRWRSTAGQTATMQRLLGVARGDTPESDPGRQATATLAAARVQGARAVLAAHTAAWDTRWQASDIRIAGDPEIERALRFAVYHLNSAANPEDGSVSIGARALTGDAYLGHVFWDTDIYLLPFYFVTWPQAARALLMYRYRTLDRARAKAARGGWRGALYAWESADTGEETTPDQVIGPEGTLVDVLSGKEEQHIACDVAYAVWNYWRASGDDGFLLEAGAEMIMETARFWASRASLEADGRRHIRGVIGPDEYHENIDDNAYTNGMARWNIARALELVGRFTAATRDGDGAWAERWPELRARLGLTTAELAQWREVVATLVSGLDPVTGILEQFAGFHRLEPINLARYADRKVPMDVVLGHERTQRTQVVKQADVVALLALLPDEFDEATKQANFRHYEERCAHGSSLSRSMHALVAARLGIADLALRYLRETAAIDLSPAARESAGGVHIAALGGLWQAVMLGFLGLDQTGAHLALAPRLPPHWQQFDCRVCWRGRVLHLAVEGAEVRAELLSGAPMTLLVHGKPRSLVTKT